MRRAGSSALRFAAGCVRCLAGCVRVPRGGKTRSLRFARGRVEWVGSALLRWWGTCWCVVLRWHPACLLAHPACWSRVLFGWPWLVGWLADWLATFGGCSLFTGLCAVAGYESLWRCFSCDRAGWHESGRQLWQAPVLKRCPRTCSVWFRLAERLRVSRVLWLVACWCHVLQ